MSESRLSYADALRACVHDTRDDNTNGVLSVETGVMVPVMVDSVRLLSSLVSVMDGAGDDVAEVD